MASGISDGSILQVTSKLRGGGKHKEKRAKWSGVGPAMPESEKDNGIKLTEENDHREIVACLSEGSDDEVEQKMQKLDDSVSGTVGSGQETHRYLAMWNETGGGSEEERKSHREGNRRRRGARQECAF